MSKPSSLTPQRLALRRPLVTVLLVFVLMQWVSLMHGLVHAGTDLQDGPRIGFAQGSLLGKLAASHDDGGSLCQGLEHLGHGHAPLASVAAQPPAPPPASVAVAALVERVAETFVARYRARAPPQLLG